MTDKKIRELQLDAIKQQTDSHFLNNTLNVIQGAFAQKEVERANTQFLHLSKIIKRALEMSHEKRINLEDEIEYLTSYLEIYKLRLNTNLSYRVNIDERIDKKTLFLPPMMIQPLIDDAINNRLVTMQSKRELWIDVLKNNSKLLISVFDNSTRIIHGYENNVFHRNSPISNLEERIELMNNGNLNKITLHKISCKNERQILGNKVYFKLNPS